jgi:SSS family solute:Na+ symporter
MVLFAIISLAFVLPAGLTSVAWTDFIFGCLMVIVSVISIIFATNMAGGWSNIVASVPAEIVELPGGMFSVGMYTIALWFLAIVPGTVTNQMYYQRIFAVDEVKKARKSLIISSLVIFTAEIYSGFLGMAIRTINPNLQGENAAGWFLTQVPVWFLAVYSGFLVATIMSTIDSAVQSVAVSLTYDVYLKNTKSDVNDKKIVTMQRLFSVAIIALSLTFSIAYPQALNWLVATYSYSASGLLFPIFIGYFLKDKKVLTAKGAIGSMLLGFAGCAFGQITNASIPYVAYGLIGSFFGLFIVSYLTRNDLKEDI